MERGSNRKVLSEGDKEEERGMKREGVNNSKDWHRKWCGRECLVRQLTSRVQI